ncbi:MAG: AAA family ATPase [Methanobrevibacter sp.]|nr:AAA family ATPase [Methanobrevibacter sp.]
MDCIEKVSPFQTGTPVIPENFEGRKEIIKECTLGLRQAIEGNAQHFFITGKRGMGKTSLATYLNEIAKKRYKMIGVHVFNDGVHTTEQLIIQIIERILNEIECETWSNKIYKKFRDNIESAGLFGVSIKFKPKDENLIDNVKDNFASFLVDLVNNFEDKSGIFIIIDDINGLTENPEFANWYKSFADDLATNYRNKSPIAFMLTGYPEKIESLYNHQPSVNRIFKHKYLSPLHNNEIKDFYIKIFDRLAIEIQEDALNSMIYYSSGLPTMMQEIGEGIFWINDDKIITKDTALLGIIRAGKEIGLKYLKPVLDSSIRSDKYLSIFNKLGSYFLKHSGDDYSFRKKDFTANLNENENKVFSDFLIKARKLGIIEFTGAKKSGQYKFTNNLYGLYFAIISLNTT